MLRCLVSALATSAFVLGWAAEPATLSLPDALRLARERNGTVRAAIFQLDASRARANQALGDFFPTLTPSYSYDTSTTNYQTGRGDRFILQPDGSTIRVPGTGRVGNVNNSVNFNASLRLLDLGERSLTLTGRRRDYAAQAATSLQTLRSTLFTVHQRYFDALRSEELLRVQQANLERANTILEQTQARVNVGDAPRKDVLQAQADALNARASVLAAQTRVGTSHADLKATIGWDQPKLPDLEPVSREEPPAPPPLEDALSLGMQRRADLQASRLRIESQRTEVRLAEIDAGIRFSVDASARKSMAPDVLDRTGLVLTASIPLFDGARSREAVRASRSSLFASEASLRQTERDARAEIESAYQEVVVSRERLVATRAALDAARVNYDAAQEAQRAGANGLIEVLTAQVSLVTAESNYVEALYDARIAEIRLRLAIGEAIPGEEI